MNAKRRRVGVMKEEIIKGVDGIRRTEYCNMDTRAREARIGGDRQATDSGKAKRSVKRGRGTTQNTRHREQY